MMSLADDRCATEPSALSPRNLNTCNTGHLWSANFELTGTHARQNVVRPHPGECGYMSKQDCWTCRADHPIGLCPDLPTMLVKNLQSADADGAFLAANRNDVGNTDDCAGRSA